MRTRKGFLGAGAAAAFAAGSAATVGAAAPQPAAAAATGIVDEAAFVASIRNRARHRQAIGAVRIADGAVLQFAVNSLNGFESGWGTAPGDVHIAIVLAGSAVTIALDDAAWRDHRLADIVHGVSAEFLTLSATQGNPFAHIAQGLGPTADRSVPALQLRGVQFFACNTALGDVANRVMAAGNGQGAPNAYTLQAHLRDHVLPGIVVVPAGISALAVLQENGYSYYSAAL
jgi:intracellular sulfur oxidation DsrE/DsrF family protein